MARTALILSVLATAIPFAARAESASAVMEVSLVVEPSCRVSATPLSFAGQAGHPMDAASEIRVVCNDATPVTVRLDEGLNADGVDRRLSSDGGDVEYAIYSDPARTLLWAANKARTGTAGPDPLTFAAYGRIEAGATLNASGSYTDSVTVTVDF